MTRFSKTMGPAYFDQMYAKDPDPWRFATSEYEQMKYGATIGALRRPSYGRGLEVGCSIGVLTRMLAERCESLLAIDGAAGPLATAATRCADQPGVTFGQMFVPAEWPAGSFDLMVFSEVLYYLDRADLGRLADQAIGSSEAGSEFVLVHWTGETNYPLSGDDAVETFVEALRPLATPIHSSRHEMFRLDVLMRSNA